MVQTTNSMKLWGILALLLFVFPLIDAQARVYMTCSAIAAEIQAASSKEPSEDLLAFCAASDEFFSSSIGQTTPTPTFAESASLFASVPEPGVGAKGKGPPPTKPAATIKLDGKEVPVSEIPSSPGVGVSTATFGYVPYTVEGGDDTGISSAQTSGIETSPNRNRPDFVWYSIIAISVRTDAEEVWRALSDRIAFFAIGLVGLGVQEVTSIGNGRVKVVLNSGDTAIFKLLKDDTNFKSRVSSIEEISNSVFPGFNFNGTYVYFQVFKETSDTSTIEIGWGPRETGMVGGDLSTGIRLMEAFLLQILGNFEGRFGKICIDGRNIRTVEGDCNNLKDEERGAAKKPLLRFGKTDPAYPKGDRNIPAGPLDINVREISNALFAMSPGSMILENQAKILKQTCLTTIMDDGNKIEVCPYFKIKIQTKKGSVSVIPFSRIVFDEFNELAFRFQNRDCTVDIILMCSGEQYLELESNFCEAKTNRWFDPVGCSMTPAEDEVLSNSAGLTDLFIGFGQFIDHDFGLSPLTQIDAEQPGFSTVSQSSRDLIDQSFPIEIPEDDFFFADEKEFEFTRARFSEENPNSQIGLHSTYLDGGQIYGVDFTRARTLRAYKGGHLKVSSRNLLPFNGFGDENSLGALIDNAPNKDSRYFVAGDVRVTEQTLLICIHTLFVREHNLVADELAAAFPQFNDEILYQTARAIVIAEYQSIVYSEWLPLLLHDKAPRPNDFRYNPSVDPTVSAILTTAAFRFGHTMIGTHVMRRGPGSSSTAKIEMDPLRDVFFTPELVVNNGIEPFLRGAAWHKCKEVDVKIVDELRNFLVGEVGDSEHEPVLVDLISLNLQRGRDMGLPSFNDIREIFKLKRYKTFSEFIEDSNLADLASDIYDGDVDLVDPFFGGLAEPHLSNAQLGETWSTIISEQFTRLRDGDRFFYKGIKFNADVINAIPRIKDVFDDKVKLRDIILRNTDIKDSELGNRASVFQL